MIRAKDRIKQYRKQFVSPLVVPGSVDALSGKFDDYTDVSLPTNQFNSLLYTDKQLRNFCDAINAIEEEQKEKIRRKCCDKYKPTAIERIWGKIGSWFHKKNGLTATVVFYLNRKDAQASKRVKAYKEAWSEKGCDVRVEYSERAWYRSVEKHIPALTHCFAVVDGNPVVREKVRLTVFDFDGSAQVARECLLFCRASMGFRFGSYQSDTSHSFFSKFYKLVTTGEGVGWSYNKASLNGGVCPSFFTKEGCQGDFKLLPYGKNTVKYME